MGTAAAAIVIAEKRIVQAFDRAGAVTPDSARTPDEVGVGTHRLSWHRLTSRAVIRESPHDSGRYYLDREVWEGIRRTRRRLAFTLLALLIGIGLYLATLGGIHAR